MNDDDDDLLGEEIIRLFTGIDLHLAKLAGSSTGARAARRVRECWTVVNVAPPSVVHMSTHNFSTALVARPNAQGVQGRARAHMSSLRSVRMGLQQQPHGVHMTTYVADMVKGG